MLLVQGPGVEFSHVYFNGVDIVVNASCSFINCTGIGSLTINDGFVNLNQTEIWGDLVIDDPGIRLYADALRVGGDVDIASAERVIVDGAVVSRMFSAIGPFEEFSVVGLVTSNGGSSSGVTGATVRLELIEQFRFQGLLLLPSQVGLLVDDCAYGDVEVHVIGSGVDGDNTYDAIRVEDASADLYIHGSVRGATVFTQNPRYGLAVEATAVNIHHDLEISGCQSGDVDNQAGTELTTDVRITEETLAEGDVPVWDDTLKVFRPGAGGGGGGGPHVATFFRGGTLSTDTGTFKMVWPFNVLINSARIAVGTAPTGASILVDVNKNGTTMFTTQGNRPAIAASAVVGSLTTPDVAAVDAGEYVTIDIDQIGSTVEGADLTCIIEWEAA